MPLDVAIVGAGIAGLTVAVALHREGHRVQIYESSRFAGEIGAAVTLAPNGIRVLRELGFDFQRARAVRLMSWDIVDGSDLTRIASQDMTHAPTGLGSPFYAVHRVDLLNELMRLAGIDETEGTKRRHDGDGITLHLSSRTEEVDAVNGIIKFTDSTVVTADLVIGADGLRSVVRDAVVCDRDRHVKVTSTGIRSFRFLIPTDVIESSQAGRELLKWKTQGSTLFADTKFSNVERHLVWYPCRDGAVHNFVGIHRKGEISDADTDFKTQMLQQFGHFDSRIVEILKLAKDTKCWELFSMKPLTSWVSGKTVIIGDAAHPMLPFGGQGANQAIEDGGVLGCVLANVENAFELPRRLQLFNKLRIKRVSRVQIMSTVRANKEHLVQDQLLQYVDPGVPIPSSFSERIQHDSGFDALRECRRALQNECNYGDQKEHLNEMW